VNFSFSDDQVLLRNSVRSALDEQCKPEHVRAMFDDPRGYGEALWGEMAKLGWLGLPFTEEQGGAGLGLVELAIVLEEMGRAAYPGPFLATVVLGGLGIQLAAARRRRTDGSPPSPRARRARRWRSSRSISTGILPPPSPRPRETARAGRSPVSSASCRGRMWPT